MSEEKKSRTVEELKNGLANLYINRVSFSEVLQVARDHCVKASTENVDKADTDQLAILNEQLDAFEEAQKPKEDEATEDEATEDETEVVIEAPEV